MHACVCRCSDYRPLPNLGQYEYVWQVLFMVHKTNTNAAIPVVCAL